MTLKQLIAQNLADIADVVNEGKPTDIRNLVEAQTRIAYKAGLEKAKECVPKDNYVWGFSVCRTQTLENINKEIEKI